MFYQLLNRSLKLDVAPISTSYQKLSSDKVKRNNSIVKVSKFKTFDSTEHLNKFCASDFALNNIIETGAFDMLKPTVMVDSNTLNVAEQVEHTLVKMLSNEQSSK